MQTTITDFTQFMAAILQGKGLSKKERAEMLSPQIPIFTKRQFPSLNNDTTSQYKIIALSYGLGWGLFKTPYGQAFFKEGHSDDGWVNYSIAIPDQQVGLVMMSNSMNGESIFKELTEYLTGVTIPWEWEGYIPYTPTTGDKNFFIKPIPLSIEFVTRPDGSVEKMKVNEDGELFELTPGIKQEIKEVFPSKELLAS